MLVISLLNVLWNKNGDQKLNHCIHLVLVQNTRRVKICVSLYLDKFQTVLMPYLLMSSVPRKNCSHILIFTLK